MRCRKAKQSRLTLAVSTGLIVPSLFAPFAIAQDVIAADPPQSNSSFFDSLEGLVGEDETAPYQDNGYRHTNANEHSDEGSLFDEDPIVDPEDDTAEAEPEANDNVVPEEDQTAEQDPFSTDLNELLSGEGQSQELVEVPEGLTVELHGLDKVTGRTSTIFVPVDEPITFGALTITAKYCEKAPPEETPEVTAFLQIDARNNEGEIARAFSGWMFASSPAISALEHPVYDVWVIDCMTK